MPQLEEQKTWIDRDVKIFIEDKNGKYEIDNVYAASGYNKLVIEIEKFKY